MKYENMSDEMLYELIAARMPEIGVLKVDNTNRGTLAAFLKLRDDQTELYTRQTLYG